MFMFKPKETFLTLVYIRDMEESCTELYPPTYVNLVRNSLRLRYYKCVNILYLYRLQLTNPSLWRRPRTPQSSSRDFLGEMVESLETILS